MWMAILKPDITRKYSEKRKRKPEECQIPKYKLNGCLVFTFCLPGGVVLTLALS